MPSVIVSTLKDQIVGQPLILKCNITAVRGITSRVDITWSSDGLELKRTEGVNTSSLTSNSAFYTDLYEITQLSTVDEDKTYECEVLVTATLSVMGTNNITLDVTGKPSYVIPVQLTVPLYA